MKSLFRSIVGLLAGLGAALTPLVVGAQDQPGLQAAFYPGRDFQSAPLLTRLDPTIDFDWDYRPPAPGLPSEQYCVRWTGALRAPETGEYTFAISTDDGMRVWLGEQQLFDEWRSQVPSTYRKTITLTAGQLYPLRVEYFQARHQARAQLRWLRPSDAGEGPEPPGLRPPEPTRIPRAVLVAGPPPAEDILEPTPEPSADVVAAPAETLGTLARGTTLTLPNIYFELNDSRLLPESARTLDELVAALQAQPALQLIVSGHTDSVGNAARNQRLSLERAQRVVEYLTSHGIGAERLLAEGYGATRPVAPNRDPAQRARNRRVEVTGR